MKRKEELLAECLDEVLQGRSTVEECLRRYPELGSDLESFSELARNIKASNVSPTPEFRRRLRARLLDEISPVQDEHRKYRWDWLVSASPVRAASAGLLTFAVLAGGTASVYASQSSLPGDVLYPVKIGVENIQVAVTRDPLDKANLYLEIAQRRIDEAAEQVSLNRTPAASALAQVPEKADAALREIEKLPPGKAGAMLTKLAEAAADQQIALGSIINGANKTSAAVEDTLTSLQRAGFIADTAYNNTAFLYTSPSVLDNLEKGRFQVEGTLLSVNGTNWNVGGVLLTGVHFTGVIPALNSQLKIDAINKNNDVYILDLQVTGSQQSSVTVQGPFTGTDKSGKVWYVGDTPIDAPSGKVPPAEGKHLEVKGVTSNSSLSVNDVTESGDQGKEKGQQAQLEGKLDSVNVAKKTIVIKVAGALLTIDVSSAKIYGSNNQAVGLDEVAAGIGKRISVDGLSKNDGITFAKQIHIETSQ